MCESRRRNKLSLVERRRGKRRKMEEPLPAASAARTKHGAANPTRRQSMRRRRTTDLSPNRSPVYLPRLHIVTRQPSTVAPFLGNFPLSRLICQIDQICASVNRPSTWRLFTGDTLFAKKDAIGRTALQKAIIAN